jgi:hypothetical protein
MSAKIQIEKRNQTNLLKWLNDGKVIESTYLFIFRTLLLQFLCDVHNREGENKMSVENEKMQEKLCSVFAE